MMPAILNSAILDSDTLFFFWDSLKNTLSPLWLWLKLIQSDSNSFILTQLDDGSHLEFCQFAFSHLSFPSQTHSHLPRLVPTICTKTTSLIHSDSTWWCQPSYILPCWIQTPCFLSEIHSKALHFMMVAILNSAIFNLAILDSAILVSTQTHSHLPRLFPTILTNQTYLIDSDSTWWWQPSRILPICFQPS